MLRSITKIFLGNVPVTKNLLMLLVIGGLYAVSIALSNTFVNIYLWKQSGEIRDIALYQLASVLLQPPAFLLAGCIAKKADRIYTLRAGVFILTAFFLAVLMAGKNVEDLLLFLGALLGIGFGFYWLGYNVLTFEITEPETRDFFNGFSGLLTSFAGMIGPLSAGFVITWLPESRGYQVIFFLSFFLFMMAVLLSMKMKHRHAKGPVYFKKAAGEIRKNKDWRKILYAHFMQGSREGIFVFIIILWVYTATNSELALGTYGFVTSAVSFLGYFLVGRFLKPVFRKHAIFIGGGLLVASVFIIVFHPVFPLLITYGIVISAAYPLMLVPYVSLTYDVLGKAADAGALRIEYLVTKEWFINSGRAFSIILFLVGTALLPDRIIIPVLMIITGAGHFAAAWCIKNIDTSFIVDRKKVNSGMPENGGGDSVT
ncbi:MFS transporter [Salibacterium qingdaonense]|uniref:MFS transporter, YQGE family, putative transporter n=1 Tax=Salibacterium qingdaonense TaxID=266892 RepID=A0A1I4JLT3_9BACI|nr:MFS transporter [Salibacterium qingdaonense]SFL67221.1 MFS transporter, YQGE family, putative transporter [Salibacterium qingdaonense]